jgi:hypothetical protein
MKKILFALMLTLPMSALTACATDDEGGDELLDSSGEPDGSAGKGDGGVALIPSTVAPEISLNDVVTDLLLAQPRAKVESLLSDLLASQISDPGTQQKLQAQVSSYIDSVIAKTATGKPFPVLPFSLLTTAQLVLANHQPKAPEAAGPVTLDITNTIAAENTSKCKPTRPSLTDVPNGLGLQQGGLPDPLMGDCALARTQGLAAVLNELSLGNQGSVVVDGAKRLISVSDIVTHLIGTGHTIVVENNRYFADFIGIWYKGKSVAAPVWIDTNIALNGGGTFTVPAPHSGYVFYIQGPKVTGTIEFFLGTAGGVAFRPVNSMHRPKWAGERAQYRYSSATAPNRTKNTFTVAAALRKRWTVEGKNMPLQGYGTFGVCSDSTGVIEQIIEQKPLSIFPYARVSTPTPASQDATGRRIFAAITALPRDIQQFTGQQNVADVVARIKTTMPMISSELQVRQPLVADQLKRLP